MNWLRSVYRGVLVCAALFAGILTMIFFPLRTNGNHANAGLGLSGQCTRLWHRAMTRAFGVPVRVYGEPATRTTLFVANHISWFDISALGSVLPVRFLSKDEVRTIPVIGWLANRAGTLYIPRGGRHASKRATRTMIGALQQNHHVALFPEGTTGSGKIKRFHSRLLQSAIEADCLMQPVAIHYPSCNGEIMHPDALFIGDTSMAESVKKFLRSKALKVEIHFLPAINTTGKSRDELASYAENEIRKVIERATVGQ